MGSAALEVNRREHTGTVAARRARAQGVIPAVLYGHGEEAVNLAIPRAALEQALQGGAHIITLMLEGRPQQALVREIQYDALGSNIVHIDFGRVARDEIIAVEVPIELHGAAKGALSGGVLDQPLHRLSIQCLAENIPDHIRVEIAALEIGDSVRVRDLQLPTGVKVTLPADTVIAIVHHPRVAEAAAPVAAEAEAATEPEVIKAKPKEEAGEEEKEKEKK